MSIDGVGVRGVPMMGRMVRVAETPERGLPEALRQSILKRACDLLPDVLKESAQYVERRYDAIDSSHGTGRERAVTDLPGRDAALKRSAIKQAVRETLRDMNDPTSSVSGAETLRARPLLQAALVSDERLAALLPLAQVQAKSPLLGLGRDISTRRLDEPVRGDWYA